MTHRLLTIGIFISIACAAACSDERGATEGTLLTDAAHSGDGAGDVGRVHDASSASDAAPEDSGRDVGEAATDAAGATDVSDAAVQDATFHDAAPGDASDAAPTADAADPPVRDMGETIDATDNCPPPRTPDGVCVQAIAWARDPETGECCMYPTPCHAPAEWEVFLSESDCRAM